MQYRPAKSLLKFKIPPAIAHVWLVDKLARKTPAMCLRSTATVFITPEFLRLPKDYQRFIIAHEAGHITLDTHDEFLADDFAVDWCINDGGGLTNILFAMTKVLSFPEDKPLQKLEQEMRCARQYTRLLDYDANINKNPKAMKNYNRSEVIDNELDSFGGKFKPFARRRAIADEKRESRLSTRQQRQDRKTDRSESRNESRETRADAKHIKEEGKADLAGQGISGNPLQGLGEVAGKLMEARQGEAPEETKILGMSKGVFFGVVAGLVILAGVAVWYFKFRKK